MFWQLHEPFHSPYSRQYRSAVFYGSAEQRAVAEQVKAELEAQSGQPLLTDIEPAGTFYRAEDYHQKYYLQQVPELRRRYVAIYPDYHDFTDSTAVARANGYAGGNGSLEQFAAEADQLSLTDQGRAILAKRAGHDIGAACGI
jgi:peptide-methionine (S)-S-oxide reductase